MSNTTLVIILTAAVGIVVSGAYVAAAIRIWQRRGWMWSVLPGITALLYSWPTASYVWRAIRGRVEDESSYLALLLFLLPALILLQVLKWSWQDDADARTIIREMEHD